MEDLANGWHTVLPSHHTGGRLSRTQVEEYERQTLKEWQRCPKEDWSGLGKHISAADNPETKSRVHSRFKPIDDLGSTQISEVKKVHYAYHSKKPPVCLARKRIKRRRGITIEMLRAEAEVMERLDHDHIVKLIGTYSILYNELYLLIWPVAVCDLSSFLDDVDALRNGQGDRDDIHSRFTALDLQMDKALGDHRGPPTLDHLTFLRQMNGCITQATAYCHNKHIRHLDLKPSNILLAPGRVYLADFGIAKNVEERDTTHTVGMIGTPKWQASEVTRSQSGEDEWSMKAADIYALGLVLLSIAAVLYSADLSDLDRILGDVNPDSRAKGLERYQRTLTQLALASQEVRQPDDHTVAPRHIIGLTSRMLSWKPGDRPSALSVDKELVELGGLDQVYHSPCCKKSTRYMTELVDSRGKDLMRRNQALSEENQRAAKRIRELEAKDETYQLRLENAEKKHAKDVANLERLLESERQQRKQIEAQLADLQRQGARPRTGRTQTRGEDPSSSAVHLRYNARHYGPKSSSAGTIPPLESRSMISEPPVAKSRIAGAQQQPEKPCVQPKSFAGAAAAGINAREGPGTSPGPMSRRTNSNSKLPVAITPVRSHTHTPSLNKDTSLTDSTLDSMTSSTFSRLSVATTASTSVAPSPSVGGTSPLLNRNMASVSTKGYIPASSTGLGIDLSSMVQNKNNSIDARPIAAGTLSPVFSSSTMSSPRTMKVELDSEHSSRSMAKVPSLTNQPSWAEVARQDRKLRT
ncbi:hypothetical protein N0V93_002728 [Gnomoniopsis smithogilvyi]|uniref:Protein kinase domain-containing protein n=1 Tax=Gnomoniopsis smithogilvyi TaxID=1191159 RepID=A0A9W8YX45_9PEZI|nr:hypothetical protein N0V93_002728 [Gnomoniopsis smithogilvyi]